MRKPNYFLWSIIENIIVQKKINLKFIKVKAYSKDVLNDKADKLAKEGSLVRNTETDSVTTLSNLHAVYKYRNLIIEQGIRKFIKRCGDAENHNYIFLLNRMNYVASLHQKKVIDWEATHENISSPTNFLI